MSLAPPPIDPRLQLTPTDHVALIIGQKIALAGCSNAVAALVTNPMDL